MVNCTTFEMKNESPKLEKLNFVPLFWYIVPLLKQKWYTKNRVFTGFVDILYHFTTFFS